MASTVADSRSKLPPFRGAEEAGLRLAFEMFPRQTPFL